MSFKIYRVKKAYYILILSFYLFSCSNEEPTYEIEEEIIVKEESRDTIQEEIDRLKKLLITSNNVKEKLTVYGNENLETKVLLKTTYGNIKIKLYNETPLHRANFIMLAKKNYFDSTLFYRIINKFMIQGGNSDDEEISSKMMKIGSYKIPNEINPKYAHTRGAIAMAVTPQEQQGDKKSSSVNFYIIQGQKMSNRYLNEIKERGIEITKFNRDKYMRVGGAPHLDGNYTVFGEVYQGLRVLSKIARVKTDKYDWPIKPVYIESIEVIE
jgi:peptidyl-prolyl cis-trans isomerase B (cyclophilin B)